MITCRTKHILIIFIILLTACASQAQLVPSTVTLPPPTETTIPPTDTPIPAPTQDPTLFGAIGQTEIQAFSLEPFAQAIFTKVMDGYIANGNIIEYQVTSITVFPSSDGGLLAEIIYNVRTTDTYWLLDGGTQAYDDWINNNCSRFDFVSTETEFQLKNRRLCG